MAGPLYRIETPKHPDWFWKQVGIIIWRLKFMTDVPNDDPMVEVNEKMNQINKWLDSLS